MGHFFVRFEIYIFLLFLVYGRRSKINGRVCGATTVHLVAFWKLQDMNKITYSQTDLEFSTLVAAWWMPLLAILLWLASMINLPVQ